MNANEDAMELGARIASTLSTGKRESTYKLVTLLALIHYSTESCPEINEELEVDLIELAERIAILYQPSLAQFQESDRLLQVKGKPRKTMFERIAQLEINRLAPPKRSHLRALAQHIAQQPLTHLQNSSQVGLPDFLFDSSWLHKGLNQPELVQHDWRIKLFPGVAWKLAKIAPLLVPVIERLWVSEVLRFNPSVAEAQVEKYLLGANRVAVSELKQPLVDEQRARCFYCNRSLNNAHVHIDHVLPWSRCGFDGLANLVAAHANCNLSKSDALPAPEHVERAIKRPYLEQVQESTNWRYGIQLKRMKRTAIGQFRLLPDQYLLWASLSESVTISPGYRAETLDKLVAL